MRRKIRINVKHRVFRQIFFFPGERHDTINKTVFEYKHFLSIIISHMGLGDIYANPEVIFIDLQGGGSKGTGLTK